MKKHTTSRYYILNYVFTGCLLLLFGNDHLLKAQFANMITGKLSDAAGIILLPLLIAFLLPEAKKYVAVISALLFVYWKLPASQPLIDFYNEYALLQTSRVVDYTDLYVLILLPIPHYLIKHIDQLTGIQIKRLSPQLVLFPAMVVLMATSPPEKHYYTRTEGNLSCYGCNITLPYEQDEIIKKLGQHQVSFDNISSLDSNTLNRFPHLKEKNAHYYRINELVIGKDTLRKLDFTMITTKRGKTTIYFNGMQVAETIKDDHLQTRLRKYYRRLLFDELKQRMNN